MQQLKVAIITEKLGTKAASSSTVIADEAIKRGHKVFEFEKEQLRFEEGKLLANAISYPERKATEINLEGIDVILFRPNPPVNMAYLTCLFLLRTIEDKVLILNKPSSVINFPEKIFPLYMANFMPPTLITADKEQIKKFAAKHGDVILKPLYDFGGTGIKKITASDDFELEGTTPIVVQKFIPEVAQGDKRILFINYKYHSAFKRTPPQGSIIANIVQGGELSATDLTAKEKLICQKLEPMLKENDIPICGIDVINDYVTEINITSPTGFKWAKEFYNLQPETELWAAIEARIQLKTGS